MTTYAVTTPAPSATDRPVIVRHRYSEFDFLRKWLCDTYPGMLVPPMPEKVMSPSQEDIQERVRSLEEFINDVCSNPYLKTDALLNGFLTTEDSQWTKLMQEAVKFPSARVASEEASAQSPGRKVWIAMLDGQTLPENPESSCTVLDNQMQRIAGLADGCVETATRMWQNAQHYAASIQMWQERIRGESAGLETTAQIDGGQAAIAKLLNDHSHMLKIVADRGTMWRDTALFQPQECKQLLLATARDKMRMIEALKNLLGRRSAALKDYRQAWHNKDRCTAQIQKYKDSGKGDKVVRSSASRSVQRAARPRALSNATAFLSPSARSPLSLSLYARARTYARTRLPPPPSFRPSRSPRQKRCSSSLRTFSSRSACASSASQRRCSSPRSPARSTSSSSSTSA